MIQRGASTKIKQLAKKFPAVGLLGPRQSGKTTLAKEMFPKKPYISFENQDNILLATKDPRAFLNQYKSGAIFDEIQRVPQLLSYMQGVIDAQPKKVGLFIITGSQNLLLLESITQTLAGRIAFIHLLPFSFSELVGSKFENQSLNKLILNGGYPRLYDKKINPVDFYPNYLLTYVERDVRQIKNITNLAMFQRFLKVCASRVGQEVNYTSIGNDTGVDQKTILSWFGILEASFIAFRLQPFYNNLGKRLTQMPKLYFYDTGLCCSLLELETESHVNTHPLRGALFENLIILELQKARFNNGQRSNLFYWRDRTGNEIDVLLDQSSQVVPIEIKTATTFTSDYLKGINYWRKINPQTKNSYVIFTGKSSGIDKTDLLNWKEIGLIKN
ncbi:MAG: ATP-binding protein [Bacteroidia bacterium]|nr:ATP-binding protein [Bacteroidia bacterium]MCF8427891.1 ATP-binding protein [Bacteroidia bacterium]MCF8447126.1 ATP-binding protein [Bacteroidia bacterium]